jgi:putative membrane protein
MKYEHFFGMHLFWWIFWLFLFVSFFFFDVPVSKKKKDNPMNILKKRFASGEITEDEYRQRKSVLDEDKKNATHNTNG